MPTSTCYLYNQSGTSRVPQTRATIRYGAISMEERNPIVRTFLSRHDRDDWIAQAPEKRRPISGTERVRLHRERSMSPDKYGP